MTPVATAAMTPKVVSQRNYLNNEHGLKSWLLTADHKRIAILYLIGVTFFFIVGGLLAFALRLELLTPSADLMAMDTYNKVFTMHGIVMIFFLRDESSLMSMMFYQSKIETYYYSCHR